MVPQSENAPIPSGMSRRRGRPTVRLRAWLKPRASKCGQQAPDPEGRVGEDLSNHGRSLEQVRDEREGQSRPSHSTQIRSPRKRPGSRVKAPATTQAPIYSRCMIRRCPRMLPRARNQNEPNRPNSGDRHQQVDGRVARDVGQPAAADEQRGDGGHQHQGHPGISESAVQPGPLRGALAGPQRDGAEGDGAQRGRHVDGDDRCELHGDLLGWHFAAAGAARPPAWDETPEKGSEMLRRQG